MMLDVVVVLSAVVGWGRSVVGIRNSSKNNMTVSVPSPGRPNDTTAHHRSKPSVTAAAVSDIKRLSHFLNASWNNCVISLEVTPFLV